MNILDKIVERKKLELSELKKQLTVEQMADSEYYNRVCYSLVESIKLNDRALICEFKRKSPSKGWIARHADLKRVVLDYQKYGAAAVSILTDSEFFGGSSDDLLKARPIVNLPILRKDFTIDEYQIHQSKYLGADAVLLIASILSKNQVENYSQLAKSLGMSVLFEVHSEDELLKLSEYVDAVGVNNRDLKSFDVDISTSLNLFDLIPDNYTRISESGISSKENIQVLWNKGFDGFLIGENFMKSPNPGQMMKEFKNSLGL